MNTNYTKNIFGIRLDINYMEFECIKPTLISELLFSKEIDFHMPCGGMGTCYKCRIKVTGEVYPASIAEKELLTQEEIENNIRFACMTYAKGKIFIDLPKPKQNKITTEGNMPEISLNPITGTNYGVSADIGTTTLAVYLYDLKNGKLIDVESDLNPQIKFGADVISRIEKSISGHKNALSEMINKSLMNHINNLCEKNNIAIKEIGTVVLTGNTAMMYLFFGKDPSDLVKAPFKQKNFFGEFIKTSNITDNNIFIYPIRCISAYIGGDTVSALIASGIYNKNKHDKKPKMLIDIGTNGEMALFCNGNLFCCSTAAGPAFEGAKIEMGMNAKNGAVYKATIFNGSIRPEIIGGCEAEGICGSGIIDVAAAMLDLEIIDETGAFCDDDDYYIIPGTSIRITQKDIREIQLGKAAICAGIYTLLHEAGLTAKDVDEVFIAGGFGNNINIKSAERIGLIPKGFADKSKFIGNGAGTGASMILLDNSALGLSEEISKKAEVIELSMNNYFSEKYIENMMFNI